MRKVGDGKSRSSYSLPQNGDMMIIFCLLFCKFVALMIRDNWNDTMCDLTQFLATFTFPAETDVEKIQADLCRDLEEPTSLINKLLQDMNLKDLSKVSCKLGGL